jgi:hypothetical protein
LVWEGINWNKVFSPYLNLTRFPSLLLPYLQLSQLDKLPLGLPAPRYASTGTVFVKIDFTLQCIAGVVYVPANSVAYKYVGTLEANVDKYAPILAKVSTFKAKNFTILV